MEINFLKYFTFKRFFNLLVLFTSYMVSRLTKQPLVWGYPLAVSIEPTNLCNLKCPECPSGTGNITRPLGNMSFNKYQNTIDAIKHKTFYLQLFLQGEPFINKELPDMICYAQKNDMYVSISTNGLLINKNNINRIIDNAPDKLIFSIDGTDEDTYRIYRAGGSFNKAIDSLKLVVEEKRRLKLKKPFIELQFIVMKQNEHQVEDIKKLAEDLGVDKLTLKTMQVYSYESAIKFLPENPEYSRYILKDNRFIIKNILKDYCFALWRTSVITWDNRVIPCCFDKDAKYECGNLNDNTFEEIWTSEKFQAFRKRILDNRKSVDICTNCTEGINMNIS